MLKGHESIVSDVGFSPDSHSLVSASFDRSVRIWKIRDGSSKVLPVTSSPVSFFSVLFSPDGRYIAAGNYDKSLRIWDSRTHRLVAEWRGHTGCVWCTVFTPDGKGLMSGSDDGTVKWWDVSLLGNRNDEKDFPLVRSFLGHGVRLILLSSHVDREPFVTQGSVFSIAFFPDNAQWMATGSIDESVRVWDTESGACQLTLEGHKDWVRRVDISRTQNLLATTGHDGHVTVWKYNQL